MSALVLLVLAGLVGLAQPFYLPGVAPNACYTWVYAMCPPHALHAQGEPIALLVNHLDSADTILPLDYYSYGG
jgi:hypothetical protein